MILRTLCLLLTSAMATPLAFGQMSDLSLEIRSTEEKILIDGILDEQTWQNATKAGSFLNSKPVDTGSPNKQTEIQAAYNQQFVYFAVTCWDEPEYVVQTLKRDNDFWDSDGFALVIDPVNRKTNGFFFGVNPLGAQNEGLIGNSSFEAPTFDWDNRWFSAVRNYEDRWTIEIAIPYKTLRYEAGNMEWGINFIRNDVKSNQISTWAHVPVNFFVTDLGYLATLNLRWN
jgi:hypothetical protein